MSWWGGGAGDQSDVRQGSGTKLGSKARGNLGCRLGENAGRVAVQEGNQATRYKMKPHLGGRGAHSKLASRVERKRALVRM